MDYNTVSFPGLGIGEFTINPTAFKITDNITIEWYAIIICAAIFVAYFVCDRLAKRFSIKGDDILDILLIGLPAGFVGARVWYILGDLQSFDSLLDMISVWNGGLAIYGGIFGGCLAAFFVCRHKKISFLNLLDLGGIGFMVGQIIGRWGNFFNVEVFGVQTDLPWRMGVGVDCIAEYVHPLFLYESLWNLLGLLLILGYMDFRRFRGELFLMYTAWYGIGRAWMEPLRDSAYNLHIFGIRVNMVLAILLAVAAIALFVILRVKKPEKLRVLSVPQKEPVSNYEAQFEELREQDEPGEGEPTEEPQSAPEEDSPEPGDESAEEAEPEAAPKNPPPEEDVGAPSAEEREEKRKEEEPWQK